MARKPRTEYEKLRDVWYAKLKKKGFEDIETDEDHLKSWSIKFALKESLRSWQAKASYYSMAERFLNDYNFESKLEQAIWAYHAEGISIREIVTTLKKAKIRKTVNRDSVFKTIKKLEYVMKKMYGVIYDNE